MPCPTPPPSSSGLSPPHPGRPTDLSRGRPTPPPPSSGEADQATTPQHHHAAPCLLVPLGHNATPTAPSSTAAAPTRRRGATNSPESIHNRHSKNQRLCLACADPESGLPAHGNGLSPQPPTPAIELLRHFLAPPPSFPRQAWSRCGLPPPEGTARATPLPINSPARPRSSHPPSTSRRVDQKCITLACVEGLRSHPTTAPRRRSPPPPASRGGSLLSTILDHLLRRLYEQDVLLAFRSMLVVLFSNFRRGCAFVIEDVQS
ncbi:formin-like protein 20 [Triticum dicoccoides]|uniref:formin-like protein 20 n=1 Tax=Triticum dicoccoides TaxID=85692 RepID=UPI00188E6E1B|nr:formin-like protein 20 [Triticum dicoccoides]